MKQKIKDTRLYPFARHWYRRVKPAARRERFVLRNFYRQFVKPGDLCFDIGANVGQTIEALVDCGARVIAVEPNPICMPALRWQFGRNRQVTLVPKAIGAKSGSIVLNYSGTASTASVLPDWPFGNDRSVMVELTTLDNLIAEFGCPRVCKVDVEGFEVDVFRGLSQPIPLIDFEIHPSALHWAHAVLTRLSTIGQITSANITTHHHASWIFPDWLSLEEFRKRIDTKPPGMEDAIVKMADAKLMA